MPYKNKKNKKTTRKIRLSGKKKGKIDPQKYVFNAYTIKKKRQTIPSEIRLSGVPPIMPIKHQKPKKKLRAK